MINVTVTGGNQAIANLKSLNVDLQRKIMRQIAMSAMAVKSDAQRSAPKAFGLLTMSADIIKREHDHTVIFQKSYAYYAEFGRKAGKWPPLQPILDWVHKKGLAGRYKQSKSGLNRRRIGNTQTMMDEDLPIAFMIRRSIGKKGTQPHPYLYPAFEREKPKFIHQLKTLV